MEVDVRGEKKGGWKVEEERAEQRCGRSEAKENGVTATFLASHWQRREKRKQAKEAFCLVEPRPNDIISGLIISASGFHESPMDVSQRRQQ